ncbi:MAG: metallophosphoesterase, partial [Acidobacteriota bacterium]
MTTFSGTFRWLHLSDLHMREGQGWERRKILKGLVSHLAEQREAGLAPDIVCVTGDIAFSGKRTEYDEATLLFKQIGEAIGHDPKNSGRWFLVPGNHDVGRSKIKRTDRAILGSVSTQDEIEELLQDGDTMELIGRRLDAYYDFTGRLLGAARHTNPTRPWRANIVELGEGSAQLRVGVLQLNTAWAGGEGKEKGELIVGGYQVQEALDQVVDAHVKLALVHHPLAYLRDQDASEVSERLTQSGGVHALLHGHLHDASSTTLVDPDGQLLTLGAGAVYNGPHDQRRGYTLGEFDLDAGEGRIRLFAASLKGFWATDTLAYAKAPKGVWTFTLPAELCPKSDDSSDGQTTKEDDSDGQTIKETTEVRTARRRTLIERYRRAVGDVYGRASFIGMADRSKRRDVAIGELFVPLQLRVPKMGEKEPKLTTEEMLRQLLVWPDAKEDSAIAPRFVVLGDPGSGKTTLTKYIAALIGGDHKLDGLDVDASTLPLLLPFREFVRLRAAENGRLSLVDFLVQQARDTLQIRVTTAFFEDALNAGKAVVLLDGLDEVGSESDREAAVQKVRAFLGQYPHVPALVTSRIAGYDRAPLPWNYHELRLEPFDDETLQHFVRTWYTSQENRADERERKIADLQTALQIRLRVRELARNPLLATLIALVHRYEATLPGERAALYDKVVETLLKTWPAQAGRSFPELDADLQRAELETLALQLQEGREARRKETDGKDEGIVLARAALIDQLFRNLRMRMSSRQDESLRGMVARWVDYLVEGTGVLVEQTPGIFAFFHLSLLEYLAACAFLRDKRVAQQIGEHFHLQTWRETCLLAIGSQATDAKFLGDVFAAIDRTKHPQRWAFLLRTMGEEAAFNDAQRTQITGGLCRKLLHIPIFAARSQREEFETLSRLSLRHASWLKDWLQLTAHSAKGHILLGLAALRFDDLEELQRLLERRDDRNELAPLLAFWPEHPLGRWAYQVTPANAAYRWARQFTSNQLTVLRAISTLIAQPGQAQNGLSSSYLSRLIHCGNKAHHIMAAQWSQRTKKSRSHNLNKPRAIKVTPSNIYLQGVSAWLVPSGQTTDPATEFSGYFDNNFTGDLAKNLTGIIPQSPKSHLSNKNVGHFTKDINRHLNRYPASYFSINFAGDLARNFANRLTNNLASHITSHFTITSAVPRPLHSPNSLARTPKLIAHNGLHRPRYGDKAERMMGIFISRIAGEAWYGLVTTHGLDELQRRVIIHHRVQNAWVLHVWPEIDEQTPKNLSPDVLALYLTLGWTQASTTWTWPATPRWIKTIEAGPPEHWLPRSQWHCCHLLHKKDDPEHRAALEAALREGLDDPEREDWLVYDLWADLGLGDG